MAPKRDLKDSTSTEDTEGGRRPRKSARTAAAEMAVNSTAASEDIGSTVDIAKPKSVDHAENADSSAAAPTDDTSVHTLSSSETTPAGEPSDLSANRSSAKGKAVDRSAPLPPTDTVNATSVEDIRNLFKLIDYVPDETIKRLMPFVRKSDDVNNRYALSCIPPGATWGTTPQTDSFLCIDNQPITIWAVGNTESPWFVTPDGEPHSRVNIGYRLPFEGDLAAVKKLFDKAKPKRVDLIDVVYSAKKMSSYGAKSGKTIVPFKNVYDATDRFRAKSSMDLLPPGVLGKRDIVLVESFFTRWRTQRDKENRRKWVNWSVAFELQAVNLLYEAPPDLVERQAKETEPAPDFDDDM